jgi:hypothetical protein
VSTVGSCGAAVIRKDCEVTGSSLRSDRVVARRNLRTFDGLDDVVGGEVRRGRRDGLVLEPWRGEGSRGSRRRIKGVARSTRLGLARTTSNRSH